MANQHNFPLLGQVFLGTKILSASIALTGTDSGKAFVNTQASGAITVSLPKAVPGLRFVFVETVAQNMTIQPTSIDTIRGSSLGAPTALAGIGQKLLLTCVTPLFWELI